MPVVKAHAVTRKQSAIVMDLSDLEREASQIIAKARAEAARLLAEAQAKADQDSTRQREEARAAGHQEGFDAGREEGQRLAHEEAFAAFSKGLQDLSSRWTQTLDILHQNMPGYVADARTDLIRLAVAIATRVTHQEALTNRQVAQSTIEETLRMVGSARTVVLLVHPDEMEMLETYLPDLLAKIRTIDSVELTPDESVSPGGCIVRFGSGEIDARMETQLQRIANELLAGES